ncbi:class I SAM-dependent methyltransferase [Mucilaginibacter auburnensis]|uniref:Methyltransferase family protein n=1 Tax=Mucilaginibacter auburnensis TaxID=1457233 RepID=A0A2H9VTG6_9SPHI|nr:class I SAM-dependent methyltransferase [Mucilaginibacter auburnensis]PJJ84082.1 methyltransferase family protein [Mucilaginibacter auburnensis]
MIKQSVKFILKIILAIGFPITFLAALWLKLLRVIGMNTLDEKIFMKVGMLPIVDHYYQPLINPAKHLTQSLRKDRNLPGIDFNVNEQLELLNSFNFVDELKGFPINKADELTYYYNNGFYESGDAEYLYNMIRHFKPRKLVEIGSGYSTLMAQNAFRKNQQEDTSLSYTHICIEPYEQPWLEKTGVEVIRKRVETIEQKFFEELAAGDILFIDSTHMIRPQGDVLFEYLEVLPILKPGVVVHIHDIFLPKDYPDQWILKEHRLWNEQYLLEAFLTFNNNYKILGAVNFLSHNYNSEFSVKHPIYSQQPGREPGAFWMVRT